MKEDTVSSIVLTVGPEILNISMNMTQLKYTPELKIHVHGKRLDYSGAIYTIKVKPFPHKTKTNYHKFQNVSFFFLQKITWSCNYFFPVLIKHMPHTVKRKYGRAENSILPMIHFVAVTALLKSTEP